MEASFIELCGARCLRIKGYTTNYNNFSLRELDKDTAEIAQSDPHQSKWRDPPVQLSRNVGGQDLPVRLCDRLELFMALNWLVAPLSTD
jgi:hypothetical protein